MPRGLRAVRGYERDGVHDRWGDGGSTTTLLSPACEKLESVCWCGLTLLLVDQQDVLDLITYSCHRRDCLDPDGNYIPGQKTTIGGQGGSGRETRRFRQFEIQHNVIREVPPLRQVRYCVPAIKREARTTGFDLALRREDVRHLWQQGKSIKDIAAALTLAFHTVNNDLAWLRKNGRLV